MGGDHGIRIKSVDRDAALRQHHHIELGVMRCLGYPNVLKDRAQPFDDLLQRQLGYGVQNSMADRYIKGLARLYSQRYTDDLRRHRIQSGSLRVESERGRRGQVISGVVTSVRRGET